MAGPTKPTKQATKGQKQIYKENQETIKLFQWMAIGTTAFYISVMLLGNLTGFISEPIYSLKYVLYIIFCNLVDFGCIALFKYMAEAKMSGSTVVDGGLDLNMEGGMAEYVKDLIILNALVQVLSLYSNYLWWLWAAAPGYAGYKVTTQFILPWIFAPAPEIDEEKDEKKQRKMDRKMRRQGAM